MRYDDAGVLLRPIPSISRGERPELLVKNESSLIEPLWAAACVANIGGGLCCASEEFVDCVEKGPGADRLDGDVAVEFADCSEGGLFAFGDRVFEPVPVFWCIVAEDESRFAVGVISI